VKATAGQDDQAAVRLRLSSDSARVLIEVWDADPQPPVPKGLGEDSMPDPQEEAGADCSWWRPWVRAGIGISLGSPSAKSSGANWTPRGRALRSRQICFPCITTAEDTTGCQEIVEFYAQDPAGA